MLHNRTEYTPVAERVAAGARVLDEIDLERLRLADGCRCILGQLFNAFVQAPLELVVDDTAVRHGWMAPSDYTCSEDWHAIAREYDELDAAWRALICERRARDRQLLRHRPRPETTLAETRVLLGARRPQP